MKTPPKLLPEKASRIADLRLDPLTRLKAQFCCAALTGHLAMENYEGGFMHDDDYIIDHAYLLGEAMFEKFVAENCSSIQKFNKALGL
jgi:hypothetical protein